MDNNQGRKLRIKSQIFFAVAFFAIIIVYNLYIKEILNFKILSIADLNPYGGWSALKDKIIDSNYEFDGVNNSIALTIAILFISIVGGRFLCGWLCPLGALQDFSASLSKKCDKGTSSLVQKCDTQPVPLSPIVLLIILIISVLGHGAKIAELSPWRALLNLPNLFSAWSEMKIGFFILLLIILLSMIIPRFFCRYICPLGAAQTLFSTFSFITIKKDKRCISCNACLKDCPMAIRLSKKETALSPECIKCMNCVDSCKIFEDRSLTLQLGHKKISPKTYAAIMLVLFFVLWLGLPKFWTSSTLGSNISTANLKDGTYEGEAKGFAARIITEVIIERGEIISIRVLNHHESKGWYDEVFMMLPKEIIKKQNLNVDAISGATKTSKGLVKSIEDALKKAIM
ncbi:MAG: 4Fe-4S binding protein [Firmicutes bacterium]|nr:4Fe-4S binding protein [Bacillota bacterium]